VLFEEMNPIQWQSAGKIVELAGYSIFTIDTGEVGNQDSEPLLILHGFPTSSYDFHLVLDQLSQHRRVIALDMLGFGFSDKPDIHYTLALQADIINEFLSYLDIHSLSLLTHDMGDSVGGELLARNLEGANSFTFVQRVLTNGSIYIELAHLSGGQQFLLALPDEILAQVIDPSTKRFEDALETTFSPRHHVDPSELQACAWLITYNHGHRVLPRTIRYIEERRANQSRFTGAIERHPSPLSILWGEDDPIAIAKMARKLLEDRSKLNDTRSGSPLDTQLCITKYIGHYPMLEGPAEFAKSVIKAINHP
jgi:pimeloyl-ACP methyl ester carboxylesterase